MQQKLTDLYKIWEESAEEAENSWEDNRPINDCGNAYGNPSWSFIPVEIPKFKFKVKFPIVKNEYIGDTCENIFELYEQLHILAFEEFTRKTSAGIIQLIPTFNFSDNTITVKAVWEEI